MEASSKGARLPENAYVALLVALAFALGCSEFIILGVEPDVASALGVPLSSVGDLVGRFALAYAICTPVLGLVTGRFRRFQLLVAYLVVFNLGNVLAVLASSYGMLLAARLVTASVSGSLLAVAMTFVADVVIEPHRARAISLVFSGFSIASVLGVPAGTMICEQFGWKAAFGAVMALAAAVSVTLLCVLPRRGSTDEPSGIREQVAILLDPRALAGMGVVVLGAGATYVFYTYVTPFLKTVLGMDPLMVSGFLVFVGVATVISNLLSGWVAGRFGIAGLVPAFALHALLLAGLFVTSMSLPLGLANIFCVGVVMYLLNSPTQTFFLKVASEDHPGAMTMASSLEPLSFNVGIAVGSAIGGVVVNGPGLAMTGPVGAALAVGAIGMALAACTLDRRRHRATAA